MPLKIDWTDVFWFEVYSVLLKKYNERKDQVSDKLIRITAKKLLEDLQSTDIKIKKYAAQNLHGISLALGRERTRKALLLPYLNSCKDEEEEDKVIIELAKFFGIL